MVKKRMRSLWSELSDEAKMKNVRTRVKLRHQRMNKKRS